MEHGEARMVNLEYKSDRFPPEKYVKGWPGARHRLKADMADRLNMPRAERSLRSKGRRASRVGPVVEAAPTSPSSGFPEFPNICTESL